MEEMRLKTMKDQEETERRVLEKIREKMERIKANQKKIQGEKFITTIKGEFTDGLITDESCFFLYNFNFIHFVLDTYKVEIISI